MNRSRCTAMRFASGWPDGRRRIFIFRFCCLPREKRRAMCALYAFLRHVDDLGDDERSNVTDRRRGAGCDCAAIAIVRCAGKPDRSDLAGAGRYRRALSRFRTNISPQSSTAWKWILRPAATKRSTELEEYCYRVASVVGLACIHIWGFRGSRRRWNRRGGAAWHFN